jgi:predicted nucleic acid-binding protein
MSFVVDASVALKWFVPEALSGAAEELLLSPAELHAPDLLVIEVANAAWRKVLRGEVRTTQAALIAIAIHRGGPTLYPSELFIERALEIALVLHHPVYDCLYLACAESLEALLVTTDERFLKAVEGTAFAALMRPLDELRL